MPGKSEPQRLEPQQSKPRRCTRQRSEPQWSKSQQSAPLQSVPRLTNQKISAPLQSVPRQTNLQQLRLQLFMAILLATTMLTGLSTVGCSTTDGDSSFGQGLSRSLQSLDKKPASMIVSISEQMSSIEIEQAIQAALLAAEFGEMVTVRCNSLILLDNPITILLEPGQELCWMADCQSSGPDLLCLDGSGSFTLGLCELTAQGHAINILPTASYLSASIDGGSISSNSLSAILLDGQECRLVLQSGSISTLGQENHAIFGHGTVVISGGNITTDGELSSAVLLTESYLTIHDGLLQALGEGSQTVACQKSTVQVYGGSISAESQNAASTTLMLDDCLLYLTGGQVSNASTGGSAVCVIKSQALVDGSSISSQGLSSIGILNRASQLTIYSGTVDASGLQSSAIVVDNYGAVMVYAAQLTTELDTGVIFKAEAGFILFLSDLFEADSPYTLGSVGDRSSAIIEVSSLVVYPDWAGSDTRLNILYSHSETSADITCQWNTSGELPLVIINYTTADTKQHSARLEWGEF